MNIKSEYDKEADAIYMYVNNRPYAYGKNLDDDRRIDYSQDNTLIGIELLSVSNGVNLNGLPNEDIIAQNLSEHGIITYNQTPSSYVLSNTGINQTPSSYVSSNTGIRNFTFGYYFFGLEGNDLYKFDARIKKEEITK